ncbi:MAG: NFACT family protein [Treponema sp.]|jgi:predicted ribosome quality control (RQC) complex YloA/Tae2 family protein|nr:NFACT family protein [Treponema sp.]
MSLNWKEINLILTELDLVGYQIQKAIQSTFEVLALKLHGKGESKTLLIALSPGACRIHETERAIPKSDRPLRFAEFLNSRIVNGWIESAEQLGDNRIVRIVVKLGPNRYKLYVRLWSNAANVVVTDETGTALDAMRRLPKRGEVSGGRYAPEETLGEAASERTRQYEVREHAAAETFNEAIDRWYAEQGSALSLDSLREQARRTFEGSMGRLQASLEKLRAKEADYAASDKLREYGDIILANVSSIYKAAEWLEAENFYNGETVRIKLDAQLGPAANAERYYELYRKAKSGLAELRAEIQAGEAELTRLEATLASLLAESNPLALNKRLKTGGTPPVKGKGSDADKKRPGLSFRRSEWLIIVGRDAAENDALLRRHVKGNDLWLHIRDYPGSYVFIKQRSGKTVPLDILLDAGNLAVFYSKGRNNGEGDLFYTPVKFLRRAKDGPKGLVIPTQEKNLHIKVDEARLKALEQCRIEK